MHLTFLGTGAGVPSLPRNVSSVALRPPAGGEVWLIDCGEGTQHQFMRSDLRLGQVTKIFISHMHGDHLYGLMGLLATRGMSGSDRPVDLYGPRGIEEYVEISSRLSHFGFPFELRVHTIASGVIVDDGSMEVSCMELDHRVETFGFLLREHDRPGRFDVERAIELGVPEGPLFGRLKRGETILLEDGRTIDGADLVGPPQKGRRVAHCCDTAYCRSSIELARGADLLIHEATFADRDRDVATVSRHSTASDAARVALEADVRRLMLTHISPRYVRGGDVTPDDLLAEARAIFPATDLAEDLATIDLAPHAY